MKRLLHNDLPDFSEKTIVIWGAGNTAILYQQGLVRFAQKHPWFTVHCYCDRAAETGEYQFCGKQVIAPDTLCELAENRDIAVFICAMSPGAPQAIKARLDDMAIPSWLLDEVILKTEAESVLRCYELLEDEASRAVYDSVVSSHLLGLPAPADCPISLLHYFSHPALRDPDALQAFVDVGAFTGDTLETLLELTNGSIRQYFGFEMDTENYASLRKTAAAMEKKWSLPAGSLRLFNCAVGDTTQSFRYIHDDVKQGMGSIIVESAESGFGSCEMTVLDEAISEPYTYLKADVEGFEYRVLRGAQRGIQKNRPLLGICIYHNPVDLYSIPLLIHEYCPDYRFALMHHSDTYSETALYCWCDT